jgi:hypothetical protein
MRPDWRPLLALSPEDVPEFMWMFRTELEDGTMVEAYKHYWTRRYVHLDPEGRGYEFIPGGIYEETDPRSLLDEALDSWETRGSIVRQNIWVDAERIDWARSASRHRISRADTLFVIEHAGICFEGRPGSKDDLGLYLFGDDENERPLEVVGYEGENGGLLVVHSMPLRERFDEEYTEALRWRR